MFALTFIRRGDILPTVISIGLFYALYLTIWFSTPSWNVNASTVRPCVWKSEGKAEPLFIFSPQTNLSVMTSTEKTCLSGNNSTNQATQAERHTVSIKAFNIEKNAKNRAYAFIFHHQLLESFSEFCKATAHVQDPHELCLSILKSQAL